MLWGISRRKQPLVWGGQKIGHGWLKLVDPCAACAAELAGKSVVTTHKPLQFETVIHSLGIINEKNEEGK